MQLILLRKARGTERELSCEKVTGKTFLRD
jgi:hypothetical protein